MSNVLRISLLKRIEVVEEMLANVSPKIEDRIAGMKAQIDIGFTDGRERRKLEEMNAEELERHLENEKVMFVMELKKELGALKALYNVIKDRPDYKDAGE